MSHSICTHTHSPTTRIATYLLALLLAMATPHGVAQSAAEDKPTAAGRVIVVTGNVVARNLEGDRALGRRAEIYVGDTIFTDAGASAQIRMVDDALISLKESTEFSIVAYQYEEDVDSDVSTIELIRGGFRTITGSIGQQNRAAYRATIGTYGTIGIRGTDYEAVITANGLFTGVYDGGTSVSNNLGNLDLGIGADFDFALISAPDAPPRGLIQQPASIGNIPFTITQDEAEDPAEDAGDENSETNDSANDAANSADGDSDSSDTPPPAAANIPAVAANTVANTQADSTSPPLRLSTPTVDLAVAATETSSSRALTASSDVEPSNTLTLNPSETRATGSVSCATASSLCVQLADGEVTGGNAVETDTSNVGNGEDSNASDNTDGVSGGSASDGTATNDSSSGDDSNNGNTDGDGNSDSSDTDTTSDDGSGNSAGNGNAGGNGNGNAGGNGNGNAGGNGNGNAGGNGNGNAGGNGNGNGNAGGNGGNGNGNGNSGNDSTGSNGNGNGGNDSTGNNGNGNGNGGNDSTGNNGNGNGNGGSDSTGNNGNGNGGNDSTGNNGNGNGNGGSDSTGNNGNGNGGNDSTGSNGNGNGGNDSTGNNGNGGGNSNAGGNGNGNGGGGSTNVSVSVTADINGDDSDDVSITGSLTLASAHPPSSVDMLNINWRRWNSSADDNFVVVSNGPDGLSLLSTRDYLAQINPAPVAKLTGQHNYATGIASSFIGGGSAGDIEELYAAMNVDFDTGKIANGSLNVVMDSQAWAIEFNGSIHEGVVALQALSGQLSNSDGLLSDSVEANLGGVFSGDTGAAFVGGFDLIDEVYSQHYVNGLYTIER